MTIGVGGGTSLVTTMDGWRVLFVITMLGVDSVVITETELPSEDMVVNSSDKTGRAVITIKASASPYELSFNSVFICVILLTR
jgi:hypothetical protein